MSRPAIDADIFKRYDIRGIYPTELTDKFAFEVGRAFASFLRARSLVVGRDMRPSGEALSAGFARGANVTGADVTDIGLVSTDALYFAVAKLGYDGGAMITASHNPVHYNGLKLSREKAIALSLETGLSTIRDQIQSGVFQPASKQGSVMRGDILAEFAAHVLTLSDTKRIKPLRIAIDAGNGMAGRTVPIVFARLRCEVIPLCFELALCAVSPRTLRTRAAGRPVYASRAPSAGAGRAWSGLHQTWSDSFDARWPAAT